MTDIKMKMMPEMMKKTMPETMMQTMMIVLVSTMLADEGTPFEAGPKIEVKVD